MALNFSSVIATPAARALATCISFTAGGPLAALTGAFVGGLLGESGAEFARVGVEKLAEAMGEGLLGPRLEALAERLTPERPSIEKIHREAVRLTLQEIGKKADAGFGEWFRNWDACLKSAEALDLEELRPEQVLAANADALFRNALDRLDAQGAAMRKGLALNRRVEPELVELVRTGLDSRIEENFRELLAKPENAEAFRRAELAFQAGAKELLVSIKGDTSAIRGDLSLTREDVVATRAGVAELRQLLTPDVIANLMQAGSAANAAHQKVVDELANQLNATRDAVFGFLSTLKEEAVPLEQLPAKLALIAQRHLEQLERLSALDPEDTEARQYIEEARDLIARAKSSADYDRADELLSLAEMAPEQALRRVETLQHEAAEAAHRLRISVAATRVERGELSLTRLRYEEAAEHFRAAAETVAAEDSELRFRLPCPLWECSVFAWQRERYKRGITAGYSSLPENP